MGLAHSRTFLTGFFQSLSLVYMLYAETPSVVWLGFLTELMNMVILLFVPLGQ